MKICQNLCKLKKNILNGTNTFVLNKDHTQIYFRHMDDRFLEAFLKDFFSAISRVFWGFKDITC